MPTSIDVRKLSQKYLNEITQTLLSEKRNVVLPHFEADSRQRKVLESNDKYLRVIAPAGAGKTRTLTRKAMEIINKNSDSRVLCLTFTNAAAGEFRERSLNGGAEIPNLKVSTINSFGFELLQTLNKRLTVVPDENQAKLIGRVFSVIKAVMEESPIWGKQAKKEHYREIYKLSNETKSLGFDHTSIAGAGKWFEFLRASGLNPLLTNRLRNLEMNDYDEQTEFLERWIPFWRLLVNRLWEKGVISLDDQKYWALNQLVSEKSVAMWLKNQHFNYIFVDEFQDINPLDLLFIKQILLLCDASLVVVGDDDQCIYEWRGCTSQFIRDIDQNFQEVTGGKKFATIELMNNYRCPRNIVTHSKSLIDRNLERIKKDIKAVRDCDANIRVIPMPTAYLTMNVVNELAAHLEDTHPDHSVAIVGRKKRQLIPIQVLLTKRNSKFRIDADLNVFGGSAFKDFRRYLDLTQVYTDARSPRENIDDLISLLNRSGNNYVSKPDKVEISEWLKEKKPNSLKEAIDYFEDYPNQYRSGYADPFYVASELRHFLESETIVDSIFAAQDVFKGFRKSFNKSKEDIFFAEPPFNHLADLAVNYEDRIDEFLDDLDNAIERASQNDPEGATIELTTALRTKGREFDTVIILDANEGVFPSGLSVQNGRIEEERRLFYVTVTRAKNNLLIFDSSRINGEPVSTSRFIEEMQLPQSAWLQNKDLDKISKMLFRELKV